MTNEVRVLILSEEPIEAGLVDKARGVSPRLQIEARTVGPEQALDGKAWEGVEVLLTTRCLPAPEQAPDLRWVQGYFAGADRALREAPALFERVRLTTASGVHMPVMGEYAIMMMLAHDHRLPQLLRTQAEGRWPSDRAEVFAAAELRGKTLGILGYGSIGREVARLARAFGMRILAAKRNPEQRVDEGWRPEGTGDPAGELPEAFFGLEELAAMLPACDYVVVVLPLTAETRQVINARTLALLRPTAFLVNYGRGELIDERALIEALKDSRLGGAALDVFVDEPLPAESELWSLPNVIVTPHIAGTTRRYDELALDLFADNLRRYLAGEPLYNRVDMGLGY